MQRKTNHPTYNDGLLEVVIVNSDVKTSFNAKKNVKTKTDLTIIQSLLYKEMTKRQEDLVFAEANGSKLNMKVKTPLFEVVDSRYKVLINNTLYSIIYIDYDKSQKEMYFYLEEEREIEG